MTSIARMVAGWERESRSEGAKRVDTFKANIIPWYLRFIRFVARAIPPLNRTLREKDQIYWSYIAEAEPRIIAQFRKYEDAFYRWEQENRSQGIGSSEAIADEQGAREEAKRLTIELQGKLDENGWPFRRLLLPNQLIFSPWEGTTEIGLALKYWRELLDTFER